MEISGKIPPAATPANTRPNPKSVERDTGAAAGADRVALSDRAKELQAARAAVKAMDEVDHEKVARIKSQIQSGTYKVDADKIAEKMLAETLLGDVD